MTAITLLLLVAVSVPAHASTPQLIKVQGFLTDKSGGPPVPANGTFMMTFELYDAALGGLLLSSVGPIPVEVTAGLYDVDVPFPASAFGEPDRHVAVIVAGEVLDPRIRIGSTPFSYMADQLDGFEGADLEESAEILTEVASAIGSHAGSPDPHTGYVKKTGDTMTGDLNVVANVDATEFTNDGDVKIHSDLDNDNNGKIFFLTGNRESMSITRDGKVGIDTAPTYKFDLNGGNAPFQITAGTGLNSQRLRFEWAGASSNSVMRIYAAGASEDIRLSTAGDSWYDGAGNFGIGTTTPAATLDVDGDVAVNGTISIPTTTRYFSLHNSGFTVYDNTMTYSRFVGTLKGQTPAQGVIFEAPVHLPHGAVITELHVNIRDDSAANDLTVHLNRYFQTSGSANAVTSTSSSGTPGVTTLSVTGLSAVVDNLNYAYAILVSWSTPTPASDIGLRNARVYYTIDELP
jgi:hypothetical protein